ncbi:long-chain acyl-CoA synthetase [Variovorax sp. HW608]|uniref:class I adenylate-forming enzyme family protein n=1 Tax=Variovorax sp. HW608 TaxID=1034889 RepID=UPI00081F9BDB|nr:long-chain fatty acid--CoA ligase [Variovorax sp. HW608]SCK42885.1 long-chain acyl-CoA synthetase [Variovorax sp. HW608]
MYLTQGLHRAVQQFPEKPATIYAGKTHSFRELAERAGRVAGMLQGLDVRAGDRVAILAHNSDSYVELLLGIWWAGAVAAPVNTRWSVTEIAYSLTDCGSAVLVVDDAFLPLVDAIRAAAAVVRQVVHAGNASHAEGLLSYEALLQSCEPITDVRRGGNELAAILYTGGTTGFPKGVMLSHANLWCGALTRLAEMFSPRDSVALLVTPFFHVSGLFRFVMQLVLGASNVMEPQFRPETVIEAIERHGVTDIVLVPSMLQMLLDHPAFHAGRLRSLQRLSYGASPMPPALLDRAMHALPHVGFCSSYGMTETSGVVSVLGPFTEADRKEMGEAVRSVGRVGLGAELRIIDSGGRDLPPGDVGEIVLRGVAVMQGYWNKPSETAAALRDGWLYTGDAGWRDDAGHIYVVDRLKDMVITGGENVYSAEVEAALMAHPAVSACAVIGVPSALWGEAVHAVVILRPGATSDGESLRDHCRTRLAGYKCPKSFAFVESLPLSAAGKVLKTRLRDEYLSRATV